MWKEKSNNQKHNDHGSSASDRMVPQVPVQCQWPLYVCVYIYIYIYIYRGSYDIGQAPVNGTIWANSYGTLTDIQVATVDWNGKRDLL